MDGLDELYQAVILDHNANPRNFGALDDATHRAAGHNPLCGDNLTVHVQLEGGRLEAVTFEGSGCAISKASASLMTTLVKGKTRAEADKIFERFHRAVTGKGTGEESLGKLEVFAGVAEFPMRVKCATLSWHTLRGALSAGGGESASVTTEE